MAITIRADVQTISGTSTSPTLIKNTGTSVGDVLTAFISFRGGSGVSCSTPSGWVSQGRYDNTSDNISTQVFTRAVDGSEAGFFTWTLGSSQAYNCTLLALVGVDTTTPVDAINGQANTTAGLTACTAPSISPSGSTDLLVFIAAACRTTAVAAGASTPPSGYTERSDTQNASTTSTGNLSQEVATITLSSSGATGTAANSYSNIHRSVGVHVAFKEPSAATYAPPPSAQVRLPFSILAR
jgi:hypothetical protein